MSSSSSSTHHPSRRGLLGVGLAALAAGASQRAGAAEPDNFAHDAPWSDGALPSISRGSIRMTRAARLFLASLQSDVRSRVVYANLGDDARTKWSNFPAGASPRAGVSLGDLSEPQRILVHDLLRASTSSQGYHKMTGAIRADDVLHDLGGENLFGAANYFVSIFGSPQDANWAWMLTGHHMSAVFTIAGERTAFTPMFTGAQPLQIPTGLHAGWQVLPDDANRAGELLASLSLSQKSAAIIAASAPGDVFAGPGRQQSLRSFAGIAAAKLELEQQRLLWLIVQEFVRNAEFEAANKQLALVRKNWNDLHFAWQGPPPAVSERFYFRVHGPRILIEYDVQEPLSSEGGHVHAITRDPVDDYGADWLALHYRESDHMPPGGPGGPGGPRGPGGPGGPRSPGGPGGFGASPPVTPANSPSPHA